MFADGRAAITLFQPEYTDVACITRPTLARGLDQRMSRRQRAVKRFLKYHLIVVVDEAHHAAGTQYQTFLEMLDARHQLVGLTATPWGPGYKQRLINAWFPQVAIERSREELIETKVLAAFMPESIPTHFRPTGTMREHEQARRLRDIPGAVMRKLEAPERQQAIIEAYMANRRAWGRTLLFAPTIGSAEDLYTELAARGVQTRAVHSYSEDRIDDNLRRWLDAHAEAVLISVGMLLEGVDLPSARTALIARPTTSPIVLNQMIGRVLRGPTAGGEATANVVYMQDDWDDFDELLAARAPWRGLEGAPTIKRNVPPEVSKVIEAAVRYAREPQWDEDDTARPSSEFALEQRSVVGFYEVDDELVPVFDNQRTALTEYIDRLRHRPSRQLQPRRRAPTHPHPRASRPASAVRGYDQPDAGI